MYHIFIHSSVDGHVGCFHVWDAVKSTAMNTGVHVSVQTMLFVCFLAALDFPYCTSTFCSCGRWGPSVEGRCLTVVHSPAWSTSSGLQQLQQAGSEVVQRFCCSEACAVSPHQGSNSGTLPWQTGSHPLTVRESQTMLFSRYKSRSGISGPYGGSIFTGTSGLFSTEAVPIYIPTKSVGGFCTLHTLSSIYCLWTVLLQGLSCLTIKTTI